MKLNFPLEQQKRVAVPVETRPPPSQHKYNLIKPYKEWVQKALGHFPTLQQDTSVLLEGCYCGIMLIERFQTHKSLEVKRQIAHTEIH